MHRPWNTGTRTEQRVLLAEIPGGWTVGVMRYAESAAVLVATLCLAMLMVGGLQKRGMREIRQVGPLVGAALASVLGAVQDGPTPWDMLWVVYMASAALVWSSSQVTRRLNWFLLGVSAIGVSITGCVLGHTGVAALAGVIVGVAVVGFSLLRIASMADARLGAMAHISERLLHRSGVLRVGYSLGALTLAAFIVRGSRPWVWAAALTLFVALVLFVRVETEVSRVAGVLLVTLLCLGGVESSVDAVPSVQYAPTTTEATSGVPSLEACAEMPQSEYLEQKDCYSAYFIQRGDAVGTGRTLDEIVALHQDNTLGVKFRPHCHEVLHDFAKDRTLKEGIDAMLGEYRITCTGGFAHGILVSYTKKVGWNAIEKEFPTFCATLTEKVVDAMVAKGKKRPEDTGWLKWNCNHMLGHVAYQNTREDMNRGAQLCAGFADGTSERQNCGAGFFMEHFLDVTRGLNGWKMPTEMAHAFDDCRKIEGAIAKACYSEVGVVVSGLARYDYPAAFAGCKEYVPGEYQKVCYGSVGRIAVVTVGYAPEKAIEACTSGASVDQLASDACLGEVAGAMLNETFAPEAAKKACEAVKEESSRKECDERRLSLQSQMEKSGAGGATGAVGA